MTSRKEVVFVAVIADGADNVLRVAAQQRTLKVKSLRPIPIIESIKSNGSE